MQNCGISAGSPCDHLEFSNLAWHLSPLTFSNIDQANYTYFFPETCKKITAFSWVRTRVRTHFSRPDERYARAERRAERRPPRSGAFRKF